MPVRRIARLRLTLSSMALVMLVVIIMMYGRMAFFSLLSFGIAGGDYGWNSLALNTKQLTSGQARQIINLVLPRTLGAGVEGPGPVGWRHTLRSWIYVVTGFDLSRPQTLLSAMLPGQEAEHVLVTHLPRAANATDSTSSDAASAGQSSAGVYISDAKWGQEPLILIFHTHTSEMYKSVIATSGSTSYHSYNTTNTGVVRVGSALAQALSTRYGIPVIHSQAIHDFPSFTQAYSNSARTVAEVLQRYPSIKIVLDIHRDGAENASFMRIVSGQKVAQVLVLATKPVDYREALHPNWQQNMHFAQTLADKMEEIHPGLLRRAPLIAGHTRYNQHLHPNMVLLEMGNYLDEESAAIRGAELLADAVASMLMEVSSPDYRPLVTPATKATPTTQTTPARQGAVQPPLAKPTPLTQPISVAPPHSQAPIPLSGRP